MTFFLGGTPEPENRQLTQYDPDDLTTHGVIVGMTGSGKTGLGVIFLEEALRNEIPTLIIDPKGDMTNLLLTFPDLAPGDFTPWVDASAAERDGKDADQAGADAADLWRGGLDSWGLSGDDIAELRAKAGMTIYTPGSEAGNPVDIIGDLAPPDGGFDADAETLRDEIEGFASGLLGLVGIEADPVSSREHILIANLVERAWQNGNSIDLGTLITQIAAPPMRKLGVFEIDRFFPEKDRMALAMKLNSLLASPSFAPWMQGTPLDIDQLLWRDGKPQAAVMYLAHLSDQERQFVVTMLLSKMISWMRSQPGSGSLRALIYMDEVFGYAPPTAQPPAKKPILTILKQARAFGVGLLLSTQNPVDLDYKAMSNAGTWCIGRLQTERDKARIVEALTTASGDVDVERLDAEISKLPKRTFVLHSTRESQPTEFHTRWAMSYLRGPMTREEVGRFKEDMPVAASAPKPSINAAPTPPDTATHSTIASVAPEVADGIGSSAIHPAAPWRREVGDRDDGTRYRPGLAVTMSMRFDEARAGIDHTETWEAVLPTLDLDSIHEAITVDYDERDFVATDDAIPFVEVTEPISQQSFFDDAERAFRDHADREITKTFRRCKPLKLVSRPAEDEAAFAARCSEAAASEADKEKAELVRRYESRLRKIKRAYDEAVAQADLAEQEAQAAQRDDLIGFGLDLLSGRKPRSSRSSSRTAQQRQQRAATKADTKAQEFNDTNAELEDKCAAVDEEWASKATDIETLEVGLESDDIRIEAMSVVWIKS